MQEIESSSYILTPKNSHIVCGLSAESQVQRRWSHECTGSTPSQSWEGADGQWECDHRWALTDLSAQIKEFQSAVCCNKEGAWGLGDEKWESGRRQPCWNLRRHWRERRRRKHRRNPETSDGGNVCPWYSTSDKEHRFMHRWAFRALPGNGVLHLAMIDDFCQAGSYICAVCGKKYKYYNCYQTHVRAHRGKAHKMVNCYWRFSFFRQCGLKYFTSFMWVIITGW